MKKISIISPLNDFINIPEKMKLLEDLMANKYDYEVIFVYDKYLPRELNSTPKYTFLHTKLTANYTDKVVAGFEKATGDCAILLNFNEPHWKDYFIHLLAEWENGAKIVLTKFKLEKPNFWQKIGSLFTKMFRKFYKWVLNSIELATDLHCYDTFQLFSKNVYSIINDFPEKNSYLRNFDCWVDQKTYIIYTQEKIKVNEETGVWSKNLTKFSLLVVAILGYVAFMIFSYPLFKLNDGIFTYIALSLAILFLLLFFANYFLFMDFVSKRTKITNQRG